MPPEKRLSLHRLASNRQLIEDRSASASSTGYAAVYGAIRFDMDSLAMAQANQSLEYETTLPTSVGRAAHNSPGSGGDPWPPLPFSDVEARNVATLLTEAGMQVAVRQGFGATEESVIALCKKNTPPKVLHFSTHGFSFPDPEPVEKARRRVADTKEPVFKRSEHPMMRSGLILAGANRVWTGGKPIQGLEDGILTAYEISQLNLEGTELVVLSACETGLGKIEGNEGIYGLQRAFKIAGAKYLLMSLWQVPDFQAEAFMNAFYREWLQGKKSIPDAFKNAQLQLKTRYPEPFYWAAFILLE
jgi:CHAT domain-containing protein